ncbi:MAG TPA: arginyltransferase [Patescibacteria group bacterium]|nr:arginyltransferase [Patescibacteria group bacterium]
MNVKSTTLQLYLLPAAPCPYLEGQIEQKVATLLNPAEMPLAPRLIERGFRRSQGMFYRQKCPTCRACIAARIRLRDFQPNDSFRRVLRKNEDLHFTIEESQASFPLYELFSKYLHTRHPDGGMTEMAYGAFQQMMNESPMDSKFLVARKGDEILGVMQFDELPDGASAVYSFFNPDEEKRSLGTWLVLKLCEYTANAGKPYIYLGLWVKGSQKMSYKARFQPLELFVDERWIDFDAAI